MLFPSYRDSINRYWTRNGVVFFNLSTVADVLQAVLKECHPLQLPPAVAGAAADMAFSGNAPAKVPSHSVSPASGSPSQSNSSYGINSDAARYVRILDTTLRDGEQSPGVGFSVKEKLDISKQLALLGVDVIEVGYPFSSPNELRAAQLIAAEVGNPKPGPTGADNANVHVPIICAFARCKKADIDVAWEGVKHAARPRILTFIATSDIHLKHKLGMTRDEAVHAAVEMVSYIKSLGCDDIQFGAEDAGRADPKMLYRIFGEVIKAGATTIGIGDTVGSLLPHELARLVSDIRANTPGVQNAVISAHCHNDLGLATANSLAAAVAGARQIEVSINGIGERAGNAALEEVVMAIKTRGQDQMGGLYTRIETKHIIAASKMVANYSGMQVQPHKAIVGKHAFMHESGIHQDGMLKYRGTYEFITSEDIGLQRSNLGIVLGKHSGRHALKTTLMQLGHDVDGEALDKIFMKFKAIAENQKEISNAELESLVATQTKVLAGSIEVV